MTNRHFSQKRLLVAEDNPYMSRILEAMLSGFGCHDLQIVADGPAALAAIGEETPDLLLANIALPGMSGLDLVRAVRDPETSKNPFLPAIILTAHSDPKYIAAARNAGAHDLVHKPVQPSVLYRSIVQVLEVPRRFVRTRTYFGPDRRRETRMDQPSGVPVKIGKEIVMDFRHIKRPSLIRGLVGAPQAA